MSDGSTTREAAIAEILAHVSTGASVRSIFRGDCTDGVVPSHWPSLSTFWRAVLDTGSDAAKAYDAAIAARAEHYADEIADIADEEPGIVSSEKGGSHYDAAHVQWQRNRIDARKWIASRLLPKRYGDRLTHVGDADNPIAITDPRAALLRGVVRDTPASGTGGESGGADG